MIGKLDTCRDYDNIILRIDSIVSNDISVEYHPDLSKLIEEYFKWICIENDTLNFKPVAIQSKKIVFERGHPRPFKMNKMVLH